MKSNDKKHPAAYSGLQSTAKNLQSDCVYCRISSRLVLNNSRRSSTGLLWFGSSSTSSRSTINSLTSWVQRLFNSDGRTRQTHELSIQISSSYLLNIFKLKTCSQDSLKAKKVSACKLWIWSWTYTSGGSNGNRANNPAAARTSKPWVTRKPSKQDVQHVLNSGDHSLLSHWRSQ